MSALTEVVPGIFQWSWYAERFGYDFHGSLVEHPAGNLAIDPVQMGDETLESLAAKSVARILLTNRNHYRDAARLAARTGAPVFVHPADAAFVTDKGVPVAGALHEGDTVGPFTAIACPGKSPGELLLHWAARRLLVVGDAFVGKAPGRLGLLPDTVMDDPAQLRRNLARIADTLDFDTALVADGHHVLQGARDALKTLVATFAR